MNTGVVTNTGVCYLLSNRRFLPLFITQFLGAFNDNAFKLAMLTLISYHLTHTQAKSEFYQALAACLFMLPYFIFSATSGQLADKYDKALIIRVVKAFEVVLMLFGAIAFWTQSIILMMVILTGMGIHSTFFGPIKYAILPEHLSQQNLLQANGLIEASTFLGIFLGTTLGALSIGVTNSEPSAAIFLTVIAALAGLISSLFIPLAPAKVKNLKVDYHLGRVTLKMLKQVIHDKSVALVIMTISWFWLIGSVVLTKLPDYIHYVLKANSMVFSFFLSLFSIGIAAGSMMVNNILKGQITLRIVPIAMIAFSFFMMDLYWSSPVVDGSDTQLIGLVSYFSSFVNCRIAFDLFMLSFSAGLFVVPLYTYLQITSPPESRAQTIAANNIYNAFFMVVGTLLVMLLLHLNITIPQVFLILSLINGIAVVVLWVNLRHLKKIS